MIELLGAIGVLGCYGAAWYLIWTAPSHPNDPVTPAQLIYREEQALRQKLRRKPSSSGS